MDRNKLEKIASEAFDRSGMNPNKKAAVVGKAVPFFEHLIKIAEKKEKEGEKTMELSEDLLFNGLLDKI